MGKAARWRWMILLSLLVGTVAAIFYPVDDAPAARVTRAAVQMAAPVVMAKPRIDAPLMESAPADADPFAPRGWLAPPPVAPTVAAVATAPAAVAPPPGLPPLPFRFVGRLDDDGKQVVYLARGEQALIARAGETLEGTYKVLGINTQQIEFEHIPTGDSQVLTLPTPDN